MTNTVIFPTFQCPECTDKFFYQSGLDHHYETHVRQKRRESGLYSDDENNDTMEKSEQKEIPQTRYQASQKNQLQDCNIFKEE